MRIRFFLDRLRTLSAAEAFKLLQQSGILGGTITSNDFNRHNIKNLCRKALSDPDKEFVNSNISSYLTVVTILNERFFAERLLGLMVSQQDLSLVATTLQGRYGRPWLEERYVHSRNVVRLHVDVLCSLKHIIYRSPYLKEKYTTLRAIQHALPSMKNWACDTILRILGFESTMSVVSQVPSSRSIKEGTSLATVVMDWVENPQVHKA